MCTGLNLFQMLNSLCEVQGNPARAGFQPAPALVGTGAALDLGDGKHPRPSELPGLGGVGARASADVEVGGGDPHLEGRGSRNSPASGGEDGLEDGGNLLPVARTSGPADRKSVG